MRVILEKLLEDTNPSLYQTLDMHIGALTSRAPSDSFHYKSGATSFRGREKELKELCDFCSDETDKFKWWAVTGAGGAGKSRLVYEFTQGMKHSGWACMWLNSSNIKSLSSISVKTIIVVDYAQAYIDVVGELIEQLAETDRSLPVRILLIERDGKSLDECSWGASLRECARRDGSNAFPQKPDSHINVKVEFGEGEGKVPLKAISERAEAYKPKERVTYKMIKEYIELKYGFKVHIAYIAEVKRDLGLPMYDVSNAVEELKQPRKHPTVEKVEAIKDALKYFKII